MHSLRSVVATLVLAAGAAFAGSFEDAMDAYGRQDYATAMRLLQPLAEGGNVRAQYGIGVMHSRGEGVPTDDTEAAAWFRRAADQGFVIAQFNLGLLYASGKGVPKDDQQAFVWFRKAADQGYAKAQNSLGAMYGKGQGVPRDDEQSVFWYRRAAEQGVYLAQSNLGLMYATGTGAPKDDREAYFWLLLASAGDSASVQVARLIGSRITAQQRAAVEADVKDWKARHPQR